MAGRVAEAVNIGDPADSAAELRLGLIERHLVRWKREVPEMKALERLRGTDSELVAERVQRRGPKLRLQRPKQRQRRDGQRRDGREQHQPDDPTA